MIKGDFRQLPSNYETIEKLGNIRNAIMSNNGESFGKPLDMYCELTCLAVCPFFRFYKKYL